MRLAIVGSCDWPNGLEPVVRSVIRAFITFFDPSVIISGGAPGIDTWAAEEATKLGKPVEDWLPENQRWEPDGFKDRNLIIAQECTDLLRLVSPLSTTYGSGWTRDRAAEMGKQTIEVSFK